MTDYEYMRYAFQGDEDAVKLVLAVVKIADVWDNLIDKEQPVADADIHKAFWLACVELPSNPAFVRYQPDFVTVFSTGILNWQIANDLQTKDQHAKEIAHVLRYSIADVATFLAWKIGGPEWAKQVGPELRLRAQKDRLENFLRELNHD